MAIVLFEDERVEWLYPITVGRPAYNVTCGSWRLLDLLRLAGQPLQAVVRDHLIELQRTDEPQLTEPLPARQPVLLVNARAVPSRTTLEIVRRIVAQGRPGAIRSDGELAAALLPSHAAPPTAPLTVDELARFLQSPAVSDLPPLDFKLPLLRYPHDAVRYNAESFGENLELRLESGDYREIAEGVFVADGAALGEHVVTDTRHGPILLDDGASVGPFSYLSGPAFLGARARVLEHAAIKDGVSLGHTTKIGGEVEASVVEAYSNKQHHGFMGHSYLGSWINLGAGTCNSDLKNTYGPVNMEYRGTRVATGMQFVGCIVGDYSKSAINTGIFTGKSIGACSMVYGFVTTSVPSFVNYARLFGQVTELPPEVMIATQERMFQRRSVQQRPCDAQLIRDMYDLTRHERQLAGEPLSL